MKSRFISLVAIVILVTSACGGGEGDDESISNVNAGPATAAFTETDAASGDSNGIASDGISATITIGSEVHEVDGAVVCLTGASVSVTLANGTDQITINHANDVILIRMTIDGADWVDAGSPPAPGVTGEGGDATVTWSGPMSSDGVTETVSIVVHC